MKTKLPLALSFLICVFAVLGPCSTHAFTNLASAYAAIGFDPLVPGNSVVVLASDQHMCMDTQGTPAPVVTTNLHPLFLRTLHAMNPPPTKIIFSGDVTSSLSQVPGIDGTASVDHYYPMATNEFAYFAKAVTTITNIAQSNIVWIPGNHDQSPRETNAETFRHWFPNMPVHQSFDVSGLHFILFNSGNYDLPSDSERAWLYGQVAATSPTQEVAVVTHQQPFPGGAFQRGVAPLLRELFGGWQRPWWVLCGHGHAYGTFVYNVGQSNVAQVAVGPVSTNTFVGFSPDVGCMFLCLSNGMAGRIYWRMRYDSFEIDPTPDWEHPLPYVAPFEQVENLLWRRLKSHVPLPEMVVTNIGVDSYEWYAYPQELQWQLRLGQHANQATHFLLLADALSFNAAVSFSADRTNWIDSFVPPSTNYIYWFPIPPAIRPLETGYVRFLGPGPYNNFIGGWGLATTNSDALVIYPKFAPIGDQRVIAGRPFTVTNVVIDPYAPPDLLTLTLLEGPVGGLFDPASGVLSWQPTLAQVDETVPVSVRVADNYLPSFSSTQHFRLTVVPPGKPVLSVRSSNPSNFIFAVNGDPDLTYTVLTSTNLQDWSLLLLTNPAALPFEVRTIWASNEQARFYRAVSDPLQFLFNSSAQDFFNRAAITNETERFAINQLVLDAQTHGWWTNCDAIYPFVGGNALSHSQNLKSSNFQITWIGGLTHNSSGVTGDGSTGFGNTGFNFKANGTAYTTNSAHLFFYNGVLAPRDDGAFIGGYCYTGIVSRAFIRRNGSACEMSGLNNSYFASGAVPTAADFRGPTMASRTGVTNVYLAVRTLSWAAGDPTPTIEPPGVLCGLLARIDQNNLPDHFSNGNLRAATIGGGMTQPQWDIFRLDWDKFQNSLSRKVP